MKSEVDHLRRHLFECWAQAVVDFEQADQLVAFDRKRIHAFQLMNNLDEGVVAATNEVMSLHISEETRRVSEMHDEVYERLCDIWEVHSELPWPPQARRIMNVKGWEYPHG